MFFDDVILYEDELDDNGCSKLSVKMVNLNLNLQKQAISGTSNNLILLKKRSLFGLYFLESDADRFFLPEPLLPEGRPHAGPGLRYPVVSRGRNEFHPQRILEA